MRMLGLLLFAALSAEANQITVVVNGTLGSEIECRVDDPTYCLTNHPAPFEFLPQFKFYDTTSDTSASWSDPYGDSVTLVPGHFQENWDCPTCAIWSIDFDSSGNATGYFGYVGVVADEIGSIEWAFTGTIGVAPLDDPPASTPEPSSLVLVGLSFLLLNNLLAGRGFNGAVRWFREADGD